MKKILKVLLIVVLAILALKFVTSSFFLWMIVALAVPQGLKYLAKNGVLPEFKLQYNAYKYTGIAVLVFTVLRMICHAHWAMYLLGSMIGLVLSYLMFEEIEKK